MVQKSKTSNLLFAIPLLMLTTFAVAQGWYFAPVSADAQKSGYGGPGQSFKDSFKANLRGSQVVPKVNTKTKGDATFNVAKNEQSIEYRITVDDGKKITKAGLYCGDKKENGPLIVSLYSNPSSADVDGLLASGTITQANILPAAQTCDPSITTVADLADAMRDRSIYVSVSSKAHPQGEIRGDLHFSGSAEVPKGNKN
jgi:hypothetical protein